MTLPKLLPHPEDLAWPTDGWPRGEPITGSPDEFARLADAAFALPPEQGLTRALLVVQRGKLVHERYDHGASPIYFEYSWSMAKSVTQALVGLLVKDGLIAPDAPVPVPEWQSEGDARQPITMNQLLQMRSGLEFREDYVDGQISDVIPMLMDYGRHDTGAFAAQKPLAAEPGTLFSYSSGTTNIICRVLRDIVGDGPTGMLRFMQSRLFGPVGMRTPTPRFDTAGTFIGSSFLLATADDFARFGYLYLRDGVWAGDRLLPEGWVDYARTPTFQSDEEAYGAHWWLHPQREGWFFASGYDGQRIYVVPEKDAVVVRLGRTDADNAPAMWPSVEALIDTLDDAPAPSR